MTNRCPPEYRHLSPAKECHLRGLRLGTIEKPGALPKMETQNAILAKKGARIRAILRLIREGKDTAPEMIKALHGAQWPAQILLELVGSGRVRPTDATRRRSVRYEVIE